MDLGDWAAWAGDAIAVAAFAYAAIAGRQSRSAKQSARHSDARADSIAKSMEMMAGALARLADANGGALVAQRRSDFAVLTEEQILAIVSEERPNEAAAEMDQGAAVAPRGPARLRPITGIPDTGVYASGRVPTPRPNVAFSIEVGVGRGYVLRNVGTDTATNVTLDLNHDGSHGGGPTLAGVTLKPFQSVDFMASQGRQKGMRMVRVSSDESAWQLLMLPGD